MRSTFLLCLIVALLPSGARASGDPVLARVLLSPPVVGSVEESELDALDRFALSWQRHDNEGARRALAAEGWDPALRAWMLGRQERREGLLAPAVASMQRAAEHFNASSSESPEVVAAFDREFLQWSLDGGDSAAVAVALSSPRTAQLEDPRWNALQARARLAAGDASAAAAEFDRAWDRAGKLERTHPAFLWRAVAHLQAGSETKAASTWVDAVSVLRRPESQRTAALVWDGDKDLRRVAARGETLKGVLRWLVRMYRREEALAYAQRELDSPVTIDAADLHVFVAEQLYRLRQHSELKKWLARPRPDSLDSEQEAELDAYPWGVARRGGNSVRVGQGFDAVAARYPNTERALEAIWESAWMWELSGEREEAAVRYAEYVRRSPDGRFTQSAALRVILLPYLDGEFTTALRGFETVRGSLGTQMNHAAALWLRMRCLQALDREDESNLALEELRTAHPNSPLWRQVPRPWVAPERGGLVASDVLESLFRTQHDAILRLGEAEGLGDPLEGLPPQLADIRRLLDLGLMAEGEARLLAWGQANRGEPISLLQAIAVAWVTGAPEIQARLAFFLELRMKGRGPELERAAAILARPTPYASAVLDRSHELGVPAAVLWSLMRRESFYDSDVVSLAGAYGLLQLLPSTAARMSRRAQEDEEPRPEQLFEPDRNLRYGMRYLRGLIDESAGDLAQALAAYNAGERNGARWSARRPADQPPELMMLLISYSETRAYVYHVLRHGWIFLDRYPALAAWDGAAKP